MRTLTAAAALLLGCAGLEGQDWPQGAGPAGDYHLPDAKAPSEWSVVHDRHIGWTKPLPETGQSTVTIRDGRLYYTCYVPVKGDSAVASDIVLTCADAATGGILWERPVTAGHPLRLSGCFADSTSPPVVVSGNRVVVFNASGSIAAFDADGTAAWSREAMAVGRSQPFVIDGRVIYTHQNYMPVDGKFGHDHGDAPREQWTNLRALDLATGEPAWTSDCGVNMGCIPMAQSLTDGTPVIGVGRGGGHSPPERPLGVSLVNGRTGETLWTLPLGNFTATQTYPVWNDHLLVFHGPEHLWVDARTAKVARRVDFCRDVPVRKWNGTTYADATETLRFKKERAITQQSNLRVGDYHYFRAYQHPYLGRIHLQTGKVEYLQLPVELVRKPGEPDRKIWSLKDPGFVPADMKNVNGFVVMGDKRSRTNTWGHHASPIMTAVGDLLYVPTLVGTVYCIRWNAERLDENAVVSINDLGPAGPTWTRASLSFSAGRLYARTIKQLICISAE